MCAASFKLSLSQVEKPPTEVELNFIQSFFHIQRHKTW